VGIAENLVGHELRGRKKIWKVIERLSKDQSDRTGIFYSIGYKVESQDGHIAFMKVTDLDLLTDSSYSVYERTRVAIQAHEFERKILEHCRGNNMDRVVVAVDFGDMVISHEQGKEPIFYLMFDLAECDVRVQVDRRSRFDLAWTLGALHDLAVAIQQLHKGEVSHNDIKPQNFLVFKDLNFRDRLQKLADLGCATSPLIASIYDHALCAGDPRYAAPEIVYAKETDVHLCSFEARRALDVYHLGSMTYFLVTGRMLTPEVIRRLGPEHRPPQEGDDWVINFVDVLPYWREAFGRALVEFKAELPVDSGGKLTVIGAALLEAVTQLGEPEPRLRGHPLNRVGHTDRLSVQQYISLFDNLRRRALH
jgi:eukaryotic-like serine/threonine-protein kinase